MQMSQYLKNYVTLSCNVEDIDSLVDSDINSLHLTFTDIHMSHEDDSETFR